LLKIAMASASDRTMYVSRPARFQPTPFGLAKRMSLGR
jgi:hypothetical protein